MTSRIGARIGARIGIGARIAGGSFAIAVLICIIAGLLLNFRMEQILRNSSDTVLAGVTAPYTESILTDGDDDFDPPGPGQKIAVIDPEGQTRLNTLPPSLLSQVTGDSAPVGTSEVSEGDTTFVVLVEQVPTAQGTWRVAAARPASEEQEVLSQMRVLMAASLAAIACGVLVTALLLTSASLRPIRRIRQAAEKLIDEPGDDVLPVGPVEDEFARLARTLNELIGKLRSSAQAQRQMVSDVSHELRTPLAILRARLELAHNGRRSADELLADIEGAEHGAMRLTSIIESLLELSSIEASSSGRSTAAELSAEVADAVDRATFRSPDRSIEIVDDIRISDAGSEFPIPPHDLGRIVDNLLTNSLRALGSAGRVTVELRATSHALALTVEDTGGGMPADFVDRAFDRFSQSDESRAAQTGTGLGLAIVAAIVDRAEGTITLQNSPGIGLSVRIEWPGLSPLAGFDVDPDDHRRPLREEEPE